MLRATERLDRGGTLWLLVLSNRRTVGTGMADSKQHYFGTIKSYSKRHDIDVPDDPEINQGFRNLVRKQLESSDGVRNSVVVGDKPDYVKLTTLGKDLLKSITDDRLRNSVKRSIGIETDELPDPWWPEQHNWENAEIVFETTSDRPPEDMDEFEIEVTATFSCPRCGTDIEHSYDMYYPVDAYSDQVEVSCSQCEQTYEHYRGNPYQAPEAVSR